MRCNLMHFRIVSTLLIKLKTKRVMWHVPCHRSSFKIQICFKCKISARYPSSTALNTALITRYLDYRIPLNTMSKLTLVNM